LSYLSKNSLNLYTSHVILLLFLFNNLHLWRFKMRQKF
jgi:hypothetical protein